MPRPPPFADLDAALAALDPKLRRAKPSRPILAMLAEARRLHGVAAEHRPQLAPLASFDVAALDGLPELAARLERAELEFWQSQGTPAALPLTAARERAIALRFALVSAARFALSAQPALLVPFAGFHRRRSLPNLVSDLTQLAELYDGHAEAFSGAGGLPEWPSEEARGLADRLVEGPSNPAQAKARGDRNLAFALLMLGVGEVRAAGRFLFRYEPEILARFADRTLRTARRKAGARRRRAAAA